MTNGGTKIGLTLTTCAALPWRCHRLTSRWALVNSIERQTGNLDTSISRLEREIDLLRGYRTRLVADVVTGKVDVREAAAHLPEEAVPEPTEADADLSLDPEAAEEDAVA